MKVIAFVGKHNVGKTTLIERLIPKLKEKGYRVCYLKHDPKGHGVTDKEGSDTHRISKLVEKLALLSPNRVTYWEWGEFKPLEIVKRFFSDCDIVILEGFKWEEEIPKISVGKVDAKNVILTVDRETPLEDIIKVIESLEDMV
ncbi:molybdopterin-guanine dinucleotide biosynthesis protein B [Aquifex aeolicus]|uniref:Molybdopterin-guainine dinucleotide biosynthesis protein B n=1 Tax=Aquifex aeolicus (strain VF5) TaxID=224324 RepID=O67345_AQUAE|nr:molybdopterin-guanine dinucleotide biosynthesis protein B [Aquifex aeolicus]AAC07295.1 molybdopterin-guainine dinucleotide biosynthesis protein B [Aquifex aeolicus VF5]